jgi:hypothetical protein
LPGAVPERARPEGQGRAREPRVERELEPVDVPPGGVVPLWPVVPMALELEEVRATRVPPVLVRQWFSAIPAEPVAELSCQPARAAIREFRWEEATCELNQVQCGAMFHLLQEELQAASEPDLAQEVQPWFDGGFAKPFAGLPQPRGKNRVEASERRVGDHHSEYPWAAPVEERGPEVPGAATVEAPLVEFPCALKLQALFVGLWDRFATAADWPSARLDPARPWFVEALPTLFVERRNPRLQPNTAAIPVPYTRVPNYILTFAWTFFYFETSSEAIAFPDSPPAQPHNDSQSFGQG